MPVQVFPLTKPLPGSARMLVAYDESCDLTVIAIDMTRPRWKTPDYATLNRLLAAVAAPSGGRRLRLVS